MLGLELASSLCMYVCVSVGGGDDGGEEVRLPLWCFFFLLSSSFGLNTSFIRSSWPYYYYNLIIVYQ